MTKPGPSIEPTRGPRRILHADDHRLFREGLKRLLAETDDLRVTGEAATGGEAMDSATTGRFDAVLLDISLPDRHGVEVLARLRETVPDLPVLMLTMHYEDQFAIRSLKLGAAGYVTKDAAPDEVIGALRTVLAGERYLSPTMARVLAEELVDGTGRPHERLSTREFQVMVRLAEGRGVKAIGEELTLSPKTISTYRSRVLEKLGLRSNSDLTRYAMENGLIC